MFTADNWESLRQFTAARIALGRAGVSLPTHRHLEFQLAHAQARDAVYRPLPIRELQQQLLAAGISSVAVQTGCQDRDDYLRAPDRGRQLDQASRQICCEQGNYDLAIVVADGLSAVAVEKHAVAFLRLLLPALEERRLTCSPVTLVRNGRVAIGDDIGQCYHCRLVIVLIGERPGLSAADSLGIYLTWHPAPGCSDAQRNCISNIRDGGQSYDNALHTLLYLSDQAFKRQLTGVALKDSTQVLDTPDNANVVFLRWLSGDKA